MLIPKGKKLKCKCGFESSISANEKKNYKVEGTIDTENKVIVTDKNSTVLPTTKITCYKCGGTKGYWWILQTRSADEAPTFFIKCTNCGNTWRQSN